MKRNFYERLKKLEKNTFDGNAMWFVHVETGDRWTPYQIVTASMKELQRLDTMTGDEFIQWQNDLGKRALPIIDQEVFNETD